MKRGWLKAAAALIGASPAVAFAATVYLNGLTGAVSFSDTDTFAMCQTSTGCDSAHALVRGTMTQLWKYLVNKLLAREVDVVRDYGADPTGNVDSTTAFQNAVNAGCPLTTVDGAGFATKEVFIPNGIYILSGQITIPNSCWIHGVTLGDVISANAGSTVIRVDAANFVAKDVLACQTIGQCKITDLTIDTFGGGTNQVGGASYARPHAGGTAYVVGDLLTCVGGTFTTACQLKVTAVSSGAVTGVVITVPGSYTVFPSATSPVSVSGGHGSSATFDMQFDNAAGISLSGPKMTLTANSASGANTVTATPPYSCASVQVCVPNGTQVEVGQDDGTFLTTTASSVAGNTITLGTTLTAPASSGQPVYVQYASYPIIHNVSVDGGFWDSVRVENAQSIHVKGGFLGGFVHDGVAAIGNPMPDSGASGRIDTDILGSSASNANIEKFGGGALNTTGTNSQFSKYSILVNAFTGPTGTLIANSSSHEQSQVCAIRVHQAVSGVEFGNISVVGNEFSHVAGAVSSQEFCVDTGTPTTAAKWTRNIIYKGNHWNDYVSASSQSQISIQDGDNIVATGNALNNNGTAGPTGISIAGNATNVQEYGNEIDGFPSGQYGTMNGASLAPMLIAGGAAQIAVNASMVPGFEVVANGAFASTGGFGANQPIFAPSVTAGAYVSDAVLGDAVLIAANAKTLRLGAGNGASTVQITGTQFSTNSHGVGVAGATSGSTLLQAAATASGTLTLPAATDTLTGRATTDTLTNKTIDTAGPNTIRVNGNTLSASAGSATVTVPNSTDTLVGRATTDTLTNKTITDPVMSNWTVSTSALTKTSDTALATVPGLSIALAAGKTYSCHGHLTVTGSGASGGLKVALISSGGLSATQSTFTAIAWNGTTLVANTTATLGSNIVANTAVVTDVYIDGSIVVNLAGTINEQAAQNASNSTSTVIGQGSDLRCVRVN